MRLTEGVRDKHQIAPMSCQSDHRTRARFPALARPSPGDRTRFPFHASSRKSGGSGGSTKYTSIEGLRRTLRVDVADSGLE